MSQLGQFSSAVHDLTPTSVVSEHDGKLTGFIYMSVSCLGLLA